MPATTHVTHTRWALRRDLPEMLAIEQACGGGWSEEDFLARLKERNCICIVALQDESVVGFEVYELRSDSLRLLRFGAVCPDAATMLLGKLLRKLGTHRRKWIEVSFAEAVQMRDAKLDDSDVDAQYLSCVLFRDLPVIQPHWLSDNVRWMCAGVHYPHLPILADALEDAGCDHAGLLALLRADGDLAGLVFEELWERLSG